MAKKSTEILRRKEKVRAASDLRGVPEGTRGRVIVANGLSWIRYWVAFDNGVAMGSIDRSDLVRSDEWDQFLIDRELASQQAEDAGPGEEVAGDAEGGGDAGGGATVNGVVVPQLLLDRTKAALDRFGVSR